MRLYRDTAFRCCVAKMITLIEFILLKTAYYVGRILLSVLVIFVSIGSLFRKPVDWDEGVVFDGNLYRTHLLSFREGLVLVLADHNWNNSTYFFPTEGIAEQPELLRKIVETYGYEPRLTEDFD